MGQFIQVKHVGDEWITKVYAAEVVKGQYGMQAMFTGENGDVLYMPEDSALRQLDRIGYTLEELNEETTRSAVWLRFYRQPNPRGTTPFWAIEKLENRASASRTPDRAGRAPAPRQTADRASQGQAVGTPELLKPSERPTPPVRQPIGHVYLDCLGFVLSEILPLWASAPKEMTPPTFADIAAVTATLFIRTEKEPGPLMWQSLGQSRRPAAPPPPSDADYPYDYDEDEETR